jgi:hypothetical protein
VTPHPASDAAMAMAPINAVHRMRVLAITTPHG